MLSLYIHMYACIICSSTAVTGDDQVDGGEGRGKGHSRTISDASFISIGSGSQGGGMLPLV